MYYKLEILHILPLFSDQILEYLIDYALEGGPGIFEPKGHHLVANL